MTTYGSLQRQSHSAKSVKPDSIWYKRYPSRLDNFIPEVGKKVLLVAILLLCALVFLISRSPSVAETVEAPTRQAVSASAGDHPDSKQGGEVSALSPDPSTTELCSSGQCLDPSACATDGSASSSEGMCQARHHTMTDTLTGVGVPNEQSEANTPVRVKAPTPTVDHYHDCGLEAKFLLVGIPPAQHKWANAVIFRESTCNYLAKNKTTGAVGLCQLNPHWHEIPEGYLTDPLVQLEWCNNYMIGRYGSWQGAYEHWYREGWQ